MAAFSSEDSPDCVHPHGCNFLKLMQSCSFILLNIASGESLKVSSVISGSVTFCKYTTSN